MAPDSQRIPQASIAAEYPAATCTDPENLIREGPTLIFLYLMRIDRIKIPQNTTKIGSSPTRERNADDCPTLNAGLAFQAIRTSIAKKL